MPYKYYLPGGGAMQFEDDVDQEEGERRARAAYPELWPQPIEEKPEEEGLFSDVITSPYKEALFNSYGQALTTGEFLSAFNNATPEQQKDPNYLNELRSSIRQRNEQAGAINRNRHTLRGASDKFASGEFLGGIGELGLAGAEAASSSLGYMTVPLAGGAAATAATGPIGGTVATASLIAAQHLGEDISRFVEEEGNSLEDFDMGKTALAIAGQTTLDVGMLGLTGVLGGVIGKTGREVVKNAALNSVGKAINKIRSMPGGYRALGASLGEGATESFQLALERWQAGLPMAPQDIDSMWEYAENFYGGMVGGGVFEAAGTGLDYLGEKRELRAERESISRLQAIAKKNQDEYFKGRIEAQSKAFEQEQLARKQFERMADTFIESVKVRPEDIHALANERNINWDGDPGFMAFTERNTADENGPGKKHLDELNQRQLSKIYQLVQSMPINETPMSLNVFNEQTYYDLFKNLKKIKRGTKKGPKRITRAQIKEQLNINDPSLSDKVVNKMVDIAIQGMEDRGLIAKRGVANVLNEQADVADKNILDLIEIAKLNGVVPGFKTWKKETGLKSASEYRRIISYLKNSGQIEINPDNTDPDVKRYKLTNRVSEAPHGYNYDVKRIKAFLVRDSAGKIVKAFNDRSRANKYINSIPTTWSIVDNQGNVISTHKNRGLAAVAARRLTTTPDKYLRKNPHHLTVAKDKEMVSKLIEHTLGQDSKPVKKSDIGYYNNNQEANAVLDNMKQRRSGRHSVQGKLVPNEKMGSGSIQFARNNPEGLKSDIVASRMKQRENQLGENPYTRPTQFHKDIEAALNKELVRLGLAKHNIKAVIMRDKDRRGSYSATDRIIRISLVAVNGAQDLNQAIANIFPTFSHETVHAAQSIGLISQHEYDSLVNAAKKLVSPNSGNTLKKTYYDYWKEIYKEVYRKNGDLDKKVEQDYEEEAIAMMYGDFARDIISGKKTINKTVNGKPVGIFKKLTNIFRGIGRAFKSLGYKDADTIMSDLFSDGFANREVGQKAYNIRKPYMLQYIKQEDPDYKIPVVLKHTLASGTVGTPISPSIEGGWNPPFKTPGTIEERLHTEAYRQRGEAEGAMNAAQNYLGTGQLEYLLEHVGDLYYRMGKEGGLIADDQREVELKATRALNALESQYGFSRNVSEDIEKNSRLKGIPYNEYVKNRTILLRKYVDSFNKLDPPSEAMEKARMAAVAIGSEDYAAAKIYLKQVNKIAQLDRKEYLSTIKAPIEKKKSIDPKKIIKPPSSDSISGIGNALPLEPHRKIDSKDKDPHYNVLLTMNPVRDKNGNVVDLKEHWQEVRLRNKGKFLDLDKPMREQSKEVRKLAVFLGLMDPRIAGINDVFDIDTMIFTDALKVALAEIDSVLNHMSDPRQGPRLSQFAPMISTIRYNFESLKRQFEMLEGKFSQLADQGNVAEISEWFDAVMNNFERPELVQAIRAINNISIQDAASIKVPIYQFMDIAEGLYTMYKFAKEVANSTALRNNNIKYVIRITDSGSKLLNMTSEQAKAFVEDAIAELSSGTVMSDSIRKNVDNAIQKMLLSFDIPGYISSVISPKIGDKGLYKPVPIEGKGEHIWVLDENTMEPIGEPTTLKSRIDPPTSYSIEIDHAGSNQKIDTDPVHLYKPEAEVDADIAEVSPFGSYKEALAAFNPDMPSMNLGRDQFAIIQHGQGFKNPIAYFVMKDEAGKKIHRVETGNKFGEVAQFYKAPNSTYTFGDRASTSAINILLDGDPHQVPTTISNSSIAFTPGADSPDVVEFLKRMTPSTTMPAKSLYDRIIRPLTEDSLNKFRQAFVDKYQALYRNERLLRSLRKERGEEYNTLASQTAHGMALFVDKAAAVMAASFKYGSLFYDKAERSAKIKDFELTGSVYDKKQGGLVDILAPLFKEGKNLFQKWHAYSIAIRADRLSAEGHLVPTTEEDRQMAKDIAAQHPEILQVHENFQRWNNHVVNFMRDTGIINDKMAEVWKKYADYVPFYKNLTDETTDGIIKIMEKELGVGEAAIINSLVNRKEHQKYEGHDKPIMDPLEAITRNVHSAIAGGLRNMAARQALADAVELGQAQRLTRPLKASYTDNTLYNLAKNEYKRSMDRPSTVGVRENGEDVYYSVNDILLYQAISGFNSARHPMIDLLSKPANFLRETITRSPNFMLANMLRDSLSVWATSGANIGNPVVAVTGSFVNAAKGILAGESETLKRIERIGGSIGGYDISEQDILGKGLKKLLAMQSKTGAGTWNFVKKMWDKAGEMSSHTEAATRMRVFESVLRETGNETEAAFQAAEVMNFSRRGNNPIYRAVASMVPFLNARIQGLDLLARAGYGSYGANQMSIQERRKAFAIRMISLTSMGLLYAMLMEDDEVYKNATREHRDNNFLIPMPSMDGFSNYISIPIAFEVGVLTKLIPEAIYRAATGGQSGRSTRISIMNALYDVMHANIIPQAIKPLVEATANYDYFKGESILDKYMVPGPDASRPSTNELAKMIGEATSISPMKIEHIMRGYTGTIGTYALTVADSATRWIFDKPRKAAFDFPDPRSLTQFPVLSRFIVNELDGGKKQTLYELKEQSDALTATLSLLELGGRKDEIKTIKKENKAILAMKKTIDRKSRQLQVLNRRKKKIEMAPNSSMTPKEKAERINAIIRQQNKILENISAIETKASLPIVGTRH